MAPLGLIGYLGVSYVVDCLDVLSAPGTPIRFEYKSGANQNVAISADSYTFDWRVGELIVNRPKVVREDGSVVLAIDHIDVSNLKPTWGAQQVVRARARHMTLSVARLRSGRFDFQDLLPKSDNKPGTIPFELHLTDARIWFEDQTSAKPWQRRAAVRNLSVAGIGDDWVASADATVEGVGSAEVKLSSIAKLGIQVDTLPTRLILTDLIHHAQEIPEANKFPEFKRLKLRSLTVEGPTRLWIPKDGSPVGLAQVVASAKGLDYAGYAVDTAQFRGAVTAEGFQGQVLASAGSNTASYQGSGSWTDGFKLGGSVRAQSPSHTALPRWVATLLPKETSFRNAHFEGWIAVDPKRFSVDGAATAQTLGYQKESATDASTRLHVDAQNVRVDVIHAKVENTPVSGLITLDTATGRLEGALPPTHVNLRILTKRFPQLKGLDGTALLAAKVSGSTKEPEVRLSIQGKGKYLLPTHRNLQVNAFDAVATYREGKLVISRGFVTSPDGLALVSGYAHPDGTLALQLSGRGLRLHLVDEGLDGTANVRAMIRGSVKAPLITGRAEAYNAMVGGQNVSAVAADFVSNLKGARLTSLNAYQGAAHLEGVAGIDFKSQRITGNLGVEGAQLEVMLGEGYAGSLEAKNVKLGGTISQPTFEAIVLGNDLVAQGQKIDSLEAKAYKKGDLIVLHDSKATAAGGTIDLSGTYDVAKSTGQFVAKAAGMSLKKVAASLERYATVEGTADGTATVSLRPGGGFTVSGTGSVDSVKVNSTLVGSGTWDASYDGTKAKGSLDVGQLDRYISLQNASFDPNTKELTGHVDLFKNELADIIAAALPSLPSLDHETSRLLGKVTGEVSSSINLGGTLDHPQFEATSTQAANLSYGSLSFGNVDASLKMANNKWSLKNLSVDGPTGKLVANGSYDQEGDVDLSADVTRLDLGSLAVLFPHLATVGGQVDLSVAVTGPAKSPQLRASAEADGLLLKQGDTNRDHALRVILDSISVSETRDGAGGIEASGIYYYRGFQGAIDAHAPLVYPFKVPEDGAISARATVKERELSEIATMTGVIDPAKTSGTVQGEVTASGTLKDLSISGAVDLNAKHIAFLGGVGMIKSVDTDLDNVSAKVSVGNGKLVVSGSAASSRGGSITADLSTDVEPLTDLTATQDLARSIMSRTLAGSIAINGFRVRQGFPANTFVDSAIKGNIGISGTIKSPLVSGDLSLFDFNTVLPPFEPSKDPSPQPGIDPMFNLRVGLGNPARLRSSTADLMISGDGTIQGSLTKPNLNFDMSVERGTIRLPAATVRIEQGGTVDISYASTGDQAVAAIPINLEGRTALTATGLQGYPERYDITIAVTGDMMKDNGLNLVASSDPPDLSQDRILALLGQIDVFSSLGAGKKDEAATRFQNAVLGYAVPTMFDTVGSKLAEALKLEYLTVEYNQFNETSVVFSKALSNEIYFTGSRQLTPPPPGFVAPYDVRLYYRPRRVKALGRHTTFSFGADQDRAWKVSMEYGFRF